MPVTRTEASGDGINAAIVNYAIALPDTNGGSVLITGYVQQPGFSTQSITGSPLTAPVAPGSGSLYWNINVDYTTGAVTVQSSVSSDPLPTATGLILYRETLTATTLVTDIDPTQSTPDTI